MSVKRWKGRYVVAAIALTIAFALSIQLGDRGASFDLGQSLAAEEESGDDYRLSSLRIFNRALLQIKENYVEPERVQPGPMLLAALDAVQEDIPEFVANYERSDEGMPSSIEIQVVDEERVFELHEMESLWEMSLRLKEIFLFVEQHLPEDPERSIEDIEYAAIDGMVRTLDPHSGLLTPTHYEEMQTQTGGEFGGLGIVISVQDDQLTVISPIDGTPASEKGIQAQDRIVRIGEESTINMNLNEAVSRLRGEPGTEVDIYIDRDGWSEPRQFTVERDIIEIESVESEALEDNVGYLKINNFQANTYPDMRAHLDELRETMGGIDGLILDMRGNPGGLLEQSIQISDIFLEAGTIVSTVGVGNTLREEQTASSSNTESDYPMIVLVDEGSASASEIVAGALQQNDRAMVVGDRTFGKGTVQILYEFPDTSALKLTVAQYLTPDGTSIQNTGIVPDLQAVAAEIEGDKISLFRSELLRRDRQLDHALENPSTRPDDEGPLSMIRYLQESQEDEEQFEEPGEFDRDFTIDLASRLLGQVPGINARTAMLEALEATLAEVFEEEMGRIEERFAEFDIDWNEGPATEDPQYSLELESNTEDGEIEAGETVELTATLHNEGSEPIYRAKALTKSDHPHFSRQEFIFGRVEAGESKSWTVNIDIPKDARDRLDRIHFVVSDDESEFEGEHYYDITVRGQQRPHYVFDYSMVGDPFADGLLRPGSEVTMAVTVENTGEVTGDDTTVYLKNMTGGEIYLERGRAVLEGLEPGERETVELVFEVRSMPEDGKASFELDIYDSGYRDFVQREFHIPVVDSEESVDALEGLATVGDQGATLRVGAHQDTDPVARASAQATLPVVARSGDWVKVELDGRRAWLESAQATIGEGESGELSGLERMKRFQKSRVSLDTNGMLTSESTISLEGLIEDEWDIQDYYIIVHHRHSPMDVESRKLSYQRVGSPTASVDSELPLFEGMNEISLVTRNEAGISTTETIYVYRE